MVVPGEAKPASSLATWASYSGLPSCLDWVFKIMIRIVVPPFEIQRSQPFKTFKQFKPLKIHACEFAIPEIINELLLRGSSLTKNFSHQFRIFDDVFA